MSKFSFKFVWNKLYCFGLGLEFYTVADQFDDIIARVLRLDFLIFSLNFTYWAQAWRKAEWL